MSKRYNVFYTTIITAIFLFSSAPTFAQKTAEEEHPNAKPIMWESVDISKRDLFLGPGGKEFQPDISKVKFIKKDTGGSTEKYKIEDAKGREWVAKIGVEAQAETVAVRIVWALGYKSEINYLVPSITIPGRGTFKNVRLEARPDKIDREERWNWYKNPFVGTKELQGLKILMALMNNWDLKNEDNNKTLLLKTRQGEELHYIVSDLGATFGDIGKTNIPIFWRIGRSKNKAKDYKNSKFVKKAKNGKVKFSYVGRNPKLFNNITIEQARWTSKLLTSLSDKQIRDAFRAANYSEDKREIFIKAFKRKILELDIASR